MQEPAGRIKMYRTFTLILAVLGMLTAAPHAQTRYVRQARVQLAEIARTFYSDWEQTTEYTGALDHDTFVDVSVWLRGGTRYAVAATCDEDCRDIDLVVTSPRGWVVARDREPDDTPVAHFTPVRSGTYRITVEMASCSDNPCSYAFGVFSK
jgi:hypothetical protein